MKKLIFSLVAIMGLAFPGVLLAEIHVRAQVTDITPDYIHIFENVSLQGFIMRPDGRKQKVGKETKKTLVADHKENTDFMTAKIPSYADGVIMKSLTVNHGTHKPKVCEMTHLKGRGNVLIIAHWENKHPWECGNEDNSGSGFSGGIEEIDNDNGPHGLGEPTHSPGMPY